MEPTLRPLLTKEEIGSAIHKIAHRLSQDYQNKDLIILMVLKGAVCLVADLIRALPIPFHLESIQCSSYGASGTRRGELQIIGLDRLNLHHKDILIVDDIFDSGHTLDQLTRAIQQKNPRSIKSCVLLRKKIDHSVAPRPDYVLFEIENLFVVGYGLDYKENYRGLPGIFVLEEGK